MKSKTWLIGWLISVLAMLYIIGRWVYIIDPYFHYHKPNIESYFYTLNNQRSQNNGIIRHFDYNALITGTSMTENFKTTEMDEIFNVNSIKVPFSGGTYKEINDNLIIALEHNPNLKIIIRGLDYGKFFDDKDKMREDLGNYPTYLYDNNLFNDVNYLFNKDIIFSRVYAMILESKKENFSPGITTFNDYSRWQDFCTFGVNDVCSNDIVLEKSANIIHLTEDEKKIIKENITQNVISLADKYPNVDFYYFFSPYSAVWWSNLVNNGTIYRQIEAEQYVIELILKHKNIHLYSFNNRTDITTDLNNYKDDLHYGQWINSLILRWIHEGKYLLTENNYRDYLDEEVSFYTNFDYSSLNNQKDYENDFYAAALLNYEFKGAEPIDLLNSKEILLELSNAEFVVDQYKGAKGIKCTGSLQRESKSKINISDYLMNNEYIGAKIRINNLDNHDFLVFYGKKVSDHGQPSVYVYNDQDEKLEEVSTNYHNINNEWQQYIIDLSKVKGNITIIFNGGYVDNTGSVESTYIFSDIILY